MKKVLLGLSILALSAGAYAQQDEQYSMNIFNRLPANAGVAGSNNAICATLIGKHQWVGFDGRPAQYMLTVHGPLKQLGIPLGVGLTVSQDVIGRSKATGARLALAYQGSIGPGNLGAGIAGGITSFTMGSFGTGDAIDNPAIDPTIPTTSAQSLKADFDLGIYYKIPNKLYVGFSSTHLNQADLGTVYEDRRHYYVMAGYQHDLTPSIALKPNIWVKSDASSTQIDINLLAEFNNLLAAGVSYRYYESVVVMGGLKTGMGPGELKLMYAYDINTNQLRKYNGGSHEVLLGYCFNIKNPTDVSKHVNPRFMHAE